MAADWWNLAGDFLSGLGQNFSQRRGLLSPFIGAGLGAGANQLQRHQLLAALKGTPLEPYAPQLAAGIPGSTIETEIKNKNPLYDIKPILIRNAKGDERYFNPAKEGGNIPTGWSLASQKPQSQQFDYYFRRDPQGKIIDEKVVAKGSPPPGPDYFTAGGLRGGAGKAATGIEAEAARHFGYSLDPNSWTPAQADQISKRAQLLRQANRPVTNVQVPMNANMVLPNPKDPTGTTGYVYERGKDGRVTLKEVPRIPTTANVQQRQALVATSIAEQDAQRLEQIIRKMKDKSVVGLARGYAKYRAPFGLLGPGDPNYDAYVQQLGQLKTDLLAAAVGGTGSRSYQLVKQLLPHIPVETDPPDRALEKIQGFRQGRFRSLRQAILGTTLTNSVSPSGNETSPDETVPTDSDAPPPGFRIER